MSFRDQPKMLLAFPVDHAPMNAHKCVDTTMPKRDWSVFDTPTWERKKKVIKFEHIPALCLRQAS